MDRSLHPATSFPHGAGCGTLETYILQVAGRFKGPVPSRLSGCLRSLLYSDTSSRSGTSEEIAFWVDTATGTPPVRALQISFIFVSLVDQKIVAAHRSVDVEPLGIGDRTARASFARYRQVLDKSRFDQLSGTRRYQASPEPPGKNPLPTGRNRQRAIGWRREAGTLLESWLVP